MIQSLYVYIQLLLVFFYIINGFNFFWKHNYFCCWYVVTIIFYRLRGDYNGEKFTYAQALVFTQCVVNALFAHAGKVVLVYYFMKIIIFS